MGNRRRTITDEERNTIRAAMTDSNARTVYILLKTVIGGSTNISTVTVTMRIVNAHPTLTPVIKDTNSFTVGLTGNAATLIALHSSVTVTFNAVAKKCASIVSKRVENGTNVLTSDGLISQVLNAPFVFSATDSRGNVVTQNGENTIIPYIDPTCVIEKNLPDANGTLRLYINGVFYNGSFGAASNTVTVQYRYKVNGGSYGSWTTMGTVDKNGNRYAAEKTLTGLDYQSVYTLQARVIDMIHTNGVLSAETAVIAMPVFDWGKNDVRFNVPVRLASLYRTEKYVAYTNEELRTALQQAYGETADESFGHYILQVAASGLDIYGGVWHMSVFRADADYGRIELVSYGSGSDGRVCVEVVNGNFRELEWANPPMSIGTEYRTTERWNGCVVYTKAVCIENMPSAGQKSFDYAPGTYWFPIKNICRIVNHTTGSTVTLPCYGGGFSICHVTGSTIYVRVFENLSAYTGYVQVWYLKEMGV